MCAHWKELGGVGPSAAALEEKLDGISSEIGEVDAEIVSLRAVVAVSAAKRHASAAHAPCRLTAASPLRKRPSPSTRQSYIRAGAGQR
jgi:hypothetical protein